MRHRHRGAALVLAMLLAAIASSIVAGLLWQQQLWLRQYDYQRDAAQAQSLARSGIDWARLILQEDARRTSLDHFGEQWAIKLPLTPLDNGEVGGELTDQQGLFNVNTLVANGIVQPDALARYRRLLAILELPASLAAALADWLDADAMPLPDGGAEDEYYMALDPPRRAANRPLVTIDELGLVAGYTPDVLARLHAFITALPQSAGVAINVNTAPPEVLAATLENLSLPDANRLAASRLGKPFQSVADFRSRLPSGITVNELVLRVSSDGFIIRVEVRQGEVRASALALIVRKGSEWPRVVWQMIE
ncbi:MAG: type II secretion system minor pseudopilin GspK [Betaproteobacteria bacterium]